LAVAFAPLTRLVHRSASTSADQPEEAPQGGAMPPAGTHGQSKPRARRTRVLLAQLAAVLCLIVIVGSFILVSALSPRGQQATSLNIAGASGLYAYLNQSIYRLDNQTHTILWQHTFASDETVQGGTPFSSDVQQPFVVHGVLYVETQENKANGRQYLYALNSANGSILWRQPSARAFVNSTAVYTLVESKTVDVSILTARDPRTGKQLWQRQYPIAGARIDPARGTDSTEGFRIVTLTDQLLYAVVWYRYNGQDIFTRYGLSPKDGSILWQDRSLISGRMPIAAAQIVNGVIYTTEYNLKPVNPPYVDSHGMTVSEMVQSRAAAYDVATGTRLWQTPEMIGEEPNGGFYLSVSNDSLYFQTYNQDWPAKARQPNSITTLHALSTLDGSQTWRYQWSDGGITGAVLQGQSLYLETSQFKATGSAQDIKVSIVALNAQTGETRWTTPVKLLDGTEKTPTPAPGNTDFSSGYTIDMAPVASSNAVYYSTPGNRVYALQPSNGQILTQFWIDKTPQTTVQDRVTLFVVP
ncbi:MAG TPA: PQQ-binding-like beta-propeller repeat protein, partial [Ktedonobacteraceae bacterium]|nr:PQQ-binding-like beta-propeller repeat protein [Ktedonobacteraceae bacterium]